MGVCSELSFSAFVQFLLFLWVSLPAHEECDSLEVWIAGSDSDAQSLVRRAFLLAIGMTDLRFWCRLKLKRIAEMRPQRQRDMLVAKGFKGQFNRCWLQAYWPAEIVPAASGSSHFEKLLELESERVVGSQSHLMVFRNFLQIECMDPSGERHCPHQEVCFLLAVCPWARRSLSEPQLPHLSNGYLIS